MSDSSEKRNQAKRKAGLLVLIGLTCLCLGLCGLIYGFMTHNLIFKIIGAFFILDALMLPFIAWILLKSRDKDSDSGDAA